MVSIATVTKLLANDLGQLPDGQRSWLEARLVPARMLAVRDTPNEPVVAVALIEDRIMYWSDFEEGWEVAKPDEGGAIATRGSNQFELSHIIYQIQSGQ